MVDGVPSAIRSQCSSAAGSVAGSGGGDQLHDPGTARPVGLDVLGCLLGPEVPTGFSSVALLESRCGERDPALSLALVVDLPAEDLLVRFDGQQQVGPLLQAPSRLLSRSFRAAFSLDSWVS